MWGLAECDTPPFSSLSLNKKRKCTTIYYTNIY